VVEAGFVDDDFLEHARCDADVVDSDFLFLRGIHWIYDNKKPIGGAPVLFGGQSFLVSDDAVQVRLRHPPDAVRPW